MAFTFHDNNSHHESLDDWMKRNKMIGNDALIDNHVHVTVIGSPDQAKE